MLALKLMRFGLALTVLAMGMLLHSAEANASDSTAASKDWSRALSSVMAACPAKRATLLHALHAQLVADRQLQLESAAWKQSLKMGAQQAKLTTQHLQAIETDLLAAVPHSNSKVFVQAEAATVQADWLKARAAEARHSLQDSENLLRERYTAAVGALGSTLDMLTGNNNAGGEGNGGEAHTSSVAQQSHDDGKECQAAVKHALELMDEDAWSAGTVSLEKQIVADMMMATKALRSKWQQEWQAHLGTAVKRASAAATVGDETAARTRLRESEGQVTRALRAAAAQRSRHQLTVDLSYREFQATMERLQRELQGSMVATHGVVGGSFRQQTVLLVSEHGAAAVGGGDSVGAGGGRIIRDTKVAAAAAAGAGASESSSDEAPPVADMRTARDDNVAGGDDTMPAAAGRTSSSSVAAAEGSTGAIWQVVRWAASSATVHEAAYVYSLIRRAEASSPETQTREGGLVRQALDELTAVMPAWEKAEIEHVDLILRALHRQEEMVAETEMSASEISAQSLYVRVRAAAMVLEARLPNTVVTGIVHELSQSLVRWPAAALLRGVVWAGSVYGQATLNLAMGVLVGIVSSSWRPKWAGRTCAIALLATTFHAVSVAAFRCGSWTAGAATSAICAFCLSVIVRWLLSEEEEPTSAAADVDASVSGPMKPAAANGSKKPSTAALPIKRVAVGKKVKQHTVVAAA